MTIMRIHSYLLLMMVALLSACITPFAPKGIEAEEGTIVIEGDIVVDGETKISLSLMRALEKQHLISHIKEAQVWVENELGEKYRGLFQSSELPYYLIDTKNLTLEQRYKLCVVYEDKEYETDFLAPLQSPEIDILFYSANETETAVDFYLTTYGSQNDSRYYKWNFKEDWEVVATYHSLVYFDPVTRTLHSFPSEYSPLLYCWKKSESTTLIAKTDHLTENTVFQQMLHTIERSDDRISYLYSIEVTQMSITKEAHTYWSVLKRNSDEVGGIFAPQPSELYGNIRCTTHPERRVLGYVSIGTHTTKRIFATTREIGIYIPFVCAPLDMASFQDMIPPPTNIDFYNSGYRVMGTTPSFNDPEDPKEWYPRRCIDCTAMGTKVKPPFWPNDHL